MEFEIQIPTAVGIQNSAILLVSASPITTAQAKACMSGESMRKFKSWFLTAICLCGFQPGSGWLFRGRRDRTAAAITAINRHRRLWANEELPVSSGQPATALQQLKRSMHQKRNGLGLCAATGPCNPRATRTDGPLTERRLRVQVALLSTTKPLLPLSL